MGLSRNNKPAGEAQVAEAEVDEQAAETPPSQPPAAAAPAKPAVAAKEAKKEVPEGHGKFRAVKIKIRDSESNVMYLTTHGLMGPRTDWVRSQLAAGVLVEEE